MTTSSYFFADMVRENSMSSGTGAMNLIGAPPGYRAFTGVVPANTPFFYCIAGVTQSAEWESGIGLVNATGQLERTSVSASSANGAKVDFSNGTKTVSLTVASAWFADVQNGSASATQMPALDVNGLSTLVLVDGAAPDNMINGAGGSDAVSARFNNFIGRNQNGPAEQATYYNTVAGFGVNSATNWTKVNPAYAAASMRIEGKWYQSGVFATEFHLGTFSADTVSEEFRTITAFVPHMKADWAAKSDIGFRSARVYFTDGRTNVGAGNARLNFDFRPGYDIIDVLAPPAGQGDRAIWRFETNNRPIVQQINAANNAYVNMPFLNNRNEEEHQTPYYLVSGAVTSLFGLKSSFTHLHLSPAANDVVRFSTANGSVTGNVTGERFDMTATGDALMDYRNLGAGKMAINLVAATGGGEYRVNGQKVVGARGAALPADATDLASAIALVNAIKARMVAHGLIAP